MNRRSISKKLLAVAIGPLVFCSCSALNSMVLHPLGVLHEQHENAERAKQAEAQAQASWPTNH